MNQFIESLMRLYVEDKVSIETLNRLLAEQKITKQEYEYIISAKNAE